MRVQGAIYEKSKSFALSIIALSKVLREQGDQILSKQILKSGTSIGANYCEALCSESPQDFVHKLSISLKEANETYYWLDILHDSNMICDEKFNILKEQVEELYKMLNSSAYTVKQKLKIQNM